MERRYRRILALYPADHRHEHGEEMIGVLLTAARDGHRVGMADDADLIEGALRIRGRGLARRLRNPRLPVVSDPRWADALAVASVVLPLLTLATAIDVLGLGPVVNNAISGASFSVLPGNYLGMWPLMIAAPVTALVMLLRWRRAAAAGALITMLSVLVLAPAQWGTYADPVVAIMVVLAGEACVALLLGAGPARGLALLGWRGTALVFAGAVVVTCLLPGELTTSGTWAVASQDVSPYFTGAWAGTSVTADVFTIVALGIAIVVALACLRGTVGRRVVALLSIPAMPFECLAWTAIDPAFDVEGTSLSLPLLYAVPVLSAVAIALAGRVGRVISRLGDPS
jgi:hypothetical protein